MELTDDCLDVKPETDTQLFVTPNREAPAVFHYADQYYLWTSGTMGWSPTWMYLYNAESPLGGFNQSELDRPIPNPGQPGNTQPDQPGQWAYGSQSTYILPNPEYKPNSSLPQFIYMADRWAPNDPSFGTYVWLPLFIDPNDELTVQVPWYDAWRLDNVTAPPSPPPPPPPMPFSPDGATLPSSAADDFKLRGGASLSTGPKDDVTSGANLRTGSPGEIGLIRLNTGVVGAGHRIDSVSLSFRYLAGYTPHENQTKVAATANLLLLDAATQKPLLALPPTTPLGDYSWDHFSGYSPPVEINATGLDLPNDEPVMLALQVTNNQRNLQIPVDDLAQGFNVRVTWAPEAKAVV